MSFLQSPASSFPDLPTPGAVVDPSSAAPPLASTSAGTSTAGMAASTTGSDSSPKPAKQYRRPTGVRSACDQCKERRVKCSIEQGQGEDSGERARCSHCIRQDKPCTFTKRIRKKAAQPVPMRASSTTGISPPGFTFSPSSTLSFLSAQDLPSQTYGAAPLPSASSSRQSTPNIGESDVGREFARHSTREFELAISTPQTRLLVGTVESDLCRSLLEHYAMINPGSHFMFGLGDFRAACETVRFRIEELAPAHRTLALTIMAVASLSSGHPDVIGLPSHLAIVHQDDMRMIGRSRKPQCVALWRRALAEARSTAAATTPSLINAGACTLLDFLQLHYKDAETVGRPWASATAHHFGAVEAPQINHLNGLVWVNAIMIDALNALRAGTAPSYSETAARNLLGFDLSQRQVPVLIDTFEGIAEHSAFIFGRVTILAKEAHSTFLSRHARRERFNRPALADFLESLDELMGRIRSLIMFFDSQEAPESPADRMVRGLFRLCLPATQGTLCQALYRELLRRTREPDAGQMTPAASREVERLQLDLGQVKRLLRDAMALVAESTYAVSSTHLVHLVHVSFLGLDQWGELALELGDDGTGTAASTDDNSYSSVLGKLIASLKRFGWSYADEGGLVSRLESARIEAVGQEVLRSYSSVFDLPGGTSMGMDTQGLLNLDDLNSLYMVYN